MGSHNNKQTFKLLKFQIIISNFQQTKQMLIENYIKNMIGFRIKKTHRNILFSIIVDCNWWLVILDVFNLEV